MHALARMLNRSLKLRNKDLHDIGLLKTVKQLDWRA